MDDLGEILVLVGIGWFICGDGEKVWPYCLGMVVVGAALYFADKAMKRPRS